MLTSEIRPPAVAGMFYEREPVRLKKAIENYLNQAHPPKIEGEIIGLVSPHAGYFYSAKTAAYGYKLIKGKKYNSVVVISPSHYEYFRGISIYNGIAYQTPLGTISIDSELRDELKDYNNIIEFSKRGHGREHALEVQLPFLQMVLEDFKLLPIVMGDQSKEFVYSLAELLAEVLKNKNVLLVASSDLSHYFSHDVANSLDSRIEHLINKFDDETLIDELEEEKVQACGGGPIVTVMKTSKLLGANKSKVLYRNDSSEASGDKHQVVGYLSAVFYKE
ncbi:MAG: AmmeMemoRadiSam system protein B [Ignavibacteria bacterium]|jgi:AmmeMemoRadiSam system protein B|nr:AmmeMemoRadiSam system protein B [Ignavibacteria bacterium]MDH7527809.1 AmmeMemoRadiSam system protein B [Ignavibacteria bacterium]NPV11044.1 AmmeMemoRadiSam system protein B [Ignavibacteria bacterium]